ncbi:MAG: cytochrome P450 [Benjaminiella poitrasii]|nr:MAG: cytochrome P450 [Benjaminiella poitrasii]
MIIDNALQLYRQVVLDKLVPALGKKGSKSSYIGMAIACVVLHQIYSTFFVVPKELRRFPTVSLLSLAKSFFINESIANRTKRLVTPLTNAGHGFYICKIPSNWTVFITDPVAAKVLLLKTDNFPKSHAIFDALGESSPVVQFLGTSNVAISNGETWKNQRKIMNPAFHRAMPVKTFGSIMPNLFERIDQESSHVPITFLMKSFTLDALGTSAFGFDFQALKGDPEGWTQKYNVVVSSLFNPWVNLFAKLDFLVKYVSPQRRRVMQATSEFNQMLENLAEKRRQEIQRGDKSDIPENEKDLLTLMIEADLRDGLQITTKELRHNIALFFLAGHDTTAHTLTFCLYNLAKNKHVQRKLRKEILHVLGDEPVDVAPSMTDLKQMTYLNMVIKENLRRSGPVDKLFTRDAVADINLAGTWIPKGTPVSIDIASIHMDPRIWQSPENFIPERFEEGGEHDSHIGLTWIPFSNGSRQCLGMNFSLTEQRVVLSMMLKRYEIDISKDSIHYNEIVFDKAFNFAPSSLELIFTRRY